MNCLRPIKIKIDTKRRDENNIEYDFEYMYVPCRKCPYCQRKISLEYVRRLLHEYETNDYNGYFVTLTYDEPFLKEEGVSKRELQLYFKRLRKSLKKPIKYYACGEYGLNKFRAHYHAIIINVFGQSDKDKIQKAWNMGITDCKPIEYGSVKYVVDYMNKVIPEEVIQHRNQPFTLKSKGLGKNWLLKYYQDIINDKCIIEKGYKVSIPRYYLKKLRDNTVPNGAIFYEYIMEKDKENIPHDNKTFIEYRDNYAQIAQINMNLTAMRRLKNK